MDYDILFKIANLSVIPAWFLLTVFPRIKLTQILVHSYVYPILLGVLYLWLLILTIGGQGGMDTLQNLKISFSRDDVLVLGWVHYLVFDLFIGAWITRDSHANKIAHWTVVPCLLFTLFAGPVGLLSYLTLRYAKVKKWMF